MHVLPFQLIFAPAKLRKFVRSFISGSTAQFLNTVFPFARHAAIIEFSVAPTVILGNLIVPPSSFPENLKVEQLDFLKLLLEQLKTL